MFTLEMPGLIRLSTGTVASLVVASSSVEGRGQFLLTSPRFAQQMLEASVYADWQGVQRVHSKTFQSCKFSLIVSVL